MSSPGTMEPSSPSPALTASHTATCVRIMQYLSSASGARCRPRRCLARCSAALEVGHTGGYFRTKHFTFAGDTLCLNIASAAYGSPRGEARVEIVEPDDTPIPGFTFQLIISPLEYPP